RRTRRGPSRALRRSTRRQSSDASSLPPMPICSGGQDSATTTDNLAMSKPNPGSKASARAASRSTNSSRISSGSRKGREERAARTKGRGGAGGGGRAPAVGGEGGELEGGGPIAPPFQRELQSSRQPSGNCQNIFLACDRLGKTLFSHIRCHRQPWGQRFVLMAQGTIELTQHIRSETCGQRRARQIDDIADVFQADASKAGNRRRLQSQRRQRQ